jgi:hypothetical protein
MLRVGEYLVVSSQMPISPNLSCKAPYRFRSPRLLTGIKRGSVRPQRRRTVSLNVAAPPAGAGRLPAKRLDFTTGLP